MKSGIFKIKAMTEKVVYAEHTERAVVVKSAYVTII